MIQIRLFRDIFDQDGVTNDGFTIPPEKQKLDKIYKTGFPDTGHEAMMEGSDPREMG